MQYGRPQKRACCSCGPVLKIALEHHPKLFSSLFQTKKKKNPKFPKIKCFISHETPGKKISSEQIIFPPKKMDENLFSS